MIIQIILCAHLVFISNMPPALNVFYLRFFVYDGKKFWMS